MMISKLLYITSFLLLTGIVLFFGPEVSAQEGVVNNGNPFLIALNQPTNVLKGKLVNVPGSLIGIGNKVYIRIPSLDAEGQYTKSYPIQPDGTFAVIMEHRAPIQELLIEVGDYRTWISVRDSVEAIFDFKQYDQTEAPEITFSGETANWSEYLYNYGYALSKYNAQDSLDNTIENLIDNEADSATFHEALNKWNRHLTTFTEEYQRKNTPTIELKRMIATVNGAKYLTYLTRFYWLTDRPMAAVFMQEIKSFNTKLNILNDAVNRYLYYLSCYMRHDWERKGVDLPVTMFINEILSSDTLSADRVEHLRRTSVLYERYRLDKENNNNSKINYVSELDSDIRILNERYGRFLEQRISSWMVEECKTRADYFLETFPGMIGEILVAKSGPQKDQLTIDRFKSEYDKLSTYIKSPVVSYFVEQYVNAVQSALLAEEDTEADRSFEESNDLEAMLTRVEFDPYAALYQNDKLDGDALFDYLVNAHKGKLVLIDFWATWCSSCFEDFENTKALKGDLEQSQLVFIYLCGDSKQEDWIARIREKRMKGLHVYLSKPQQQALFKRFKLNAYPSYLFVDKAGKIEFNFGRLLDRPAEAMDFVKQKLTAE